MLEGLEGVGFSRVDLELTIWPLHKSHFHTPLLDPKTCHHVSQPPVVAMISSVAMGPESGL